MKPVIIYVDDEPRNLSLFSLMLEDQYDIKLFDNAVEALKCLKQVDPWVIVTDQRMPAMTGLEFLELAAQILPMVPRIIITGQTNEDTIIKLVRHAKLFDYITKPVMEDDVVGALNKAVEFHKNQREMARMLGEMELMNKTLKEKARDLEQQNVELINAKNLEISLRREAEAWASAEVIQAVLERRLKFPIRRDLLCITYDIVGSGHLHEVTVEDINIRGYVLNLFTAALLKFGGIPECHGGDAAFGHFGAFSDLAASGYSAIAVAQDFRVALRSISRIYGVRAECGIAVHLAKQSLVQVHEVSVESTKGQRVKKFLSSSSPEIDFMFRLEKLTHSLPGSNIIFTSDVFDMMPNKDRIIELGFPVVNQKAFNCRCYMIPSDMASAEILAVFKAQHFLDSFPEAERKEDEPQSA